MAHNYNRYQNSRRYSVCETKQVSSAKHQNLFSNFHNLPLVNSIKQSASPTKPSLNMKPISQIAEKIVYDEIFDNSDNCSPLKQTLLKRSLYQGSKEVPKIDFPRRVQTNNAIKQEQFSIETHTIPFQMEKGEAPQTCCRKQEKNIFRKRDYSTGRQNRMNSIQLNDSFKKLDYTVDIPKHDFNDECFDTQQSKNEYLVSETQRPRHQSTMKTSTIIQKHYQPLIDIEKIFKSQNNSYFQDNTKEYKKLKLIFLFVRSAMRISQRIRQEKKIQLMKYQAILKLREPHYKYVSMFGQKNIKEEHQKYIKMVSNKMLYFFMDKKYVNECRQIWNKQSDFEKDLRRTRFSAFSQMFLQNLELLTRGNNLPSLIQHQLNNCLFKTKDMQISQFVSKRARIFSKKVTTLTIEEKLLLASEFFVFQVLIPNLIELVNDLSTKSAPHKNQTMFYCFGLASMMQILFTNYFSNMRETETTNIAPIQRIVTVQTSEKNGMMRAAIEIDQNLEKDETQILLGCFQRGSIVDIFYQKPDWNDRMKKFFSQLVSNLQYQIQI